MPEMSAEVEELRKKAEAGDAESQYRYAQTLQYGLGVPMDDDQSLQWYRASADQGFERARFSLGEICKEGRITPQDLVQACAWYLAVVDSAGDLAAAGQEGCDEVTACMTPEQITEAHARASALRA